ncbi:D-amino-acid transaminase [Rhizorhapis sp.]|uniref:D-amino-acid transaminase n=1 Tax=Rhizorhapis sp. TaxID=1968842 RepID=UPI002B4A1779|nr:D-amino-acid transaminase [Rhizorhapis sp.]HKR18311.1 D-amino-acid transaminase [Rhizorhapis sp.]
MNRIAYVNGEWVPLNEARISVLDRGFLFADGIYEVWAVLEGRLVDRAAHLDRLTRSAREIGLPLPDGVAALIAGAVERNRLSNGLVYLQVTRGAAERDFAFPAAAHPSIVIFTQHKEILNAPAAATGIKVKTVPDLRWVRRDIKSVALLAQVLAKQEAAEAGCQEAWLVQDGLVTEGASSSAFIVTAEGALITRPNSKDILPGCTRKAVLALADETGITVEERAFSVEEALDAREAFITSASNFVLPVVEIDGRVLGDGRPGPVARRLREIYIAAALAGD